MKLWDKGYSINNLIETYTVGNDRVLDMKLAKYDVLGNIAHAKMLHKIGILTEKELQDIEKGLQEIQTEIEEGTFIIEDNFEDVHSKIEFQLTQKIGEAGKKIHTARSRNDQVLVDLHLYIKDELKEIKELTKNLFDLFLKLSEKHKDILIPGYTHLQVAMPSSFGLWFGAYAETLISDVILLNAVYKITDQNPLGSAAGYGSSFPIDRQMTTDLLGFSTLNYNVIAAQMSRGKLEKTVAFALASLAGTLSKFAMDVCLYNSQNFGFLSFPKELTTGSSIMPHKQNPDVFELLRGKSNKIQNLPAELIMITNNLPSGYHRDFQLLKGSVMEAIETTKENLIVCHFMLENIIIHENIMDNSLYDYVYSVEELNKLVLNGMSFREAYQQLGKQILEGNFNPEKTVHHTHEGSIGNLCLKEIKAKFDKVF
ncbi:argininosuccinate lyase [Bernardetia sp. OM2101]|uniref:argininosuccinate lyase n=1 Tax=Bernardetia sp. OM2101 TaxID=3344876 RepID=UPI0035D00CA7